MNDIETLGIEAGFIRIFVIRLCRCRVVLGFGALGVLRFSTHFQAEGSGFVVLGGFSGFCSNVLKGHSRGLN